MAENNWELELNEYIRQGEPDKVDKSNTWKTAIGLQDVDGLKTSKYLLKTHGILEMPQFEQIIMICKMEFMLQQNFQRSFLKTC